MHYVEIDDSEYKRLQEAARTKKYGNLASWKELYLFQRTIASLAQIKEISLWAKRKRRGEKIILPLKNNTL